MGTAIVVAIVSGIVSLVSVAANAFITFTNVRAETRRAREARDAEDRRAREGREAEDRRLRDDRDAESKRREDERIEVQDATAGRRNAEQIEARWAFVRAVIEAEAQVVEDPGLYSFRYRFQLQSLSLLTHPGEANLLAALRQRAAMSRGTPTSVSTQIRPEWWHPWVSEWATDPQVAMVYGEADEGKVFSTSCTQVQPGTGQVQRASRPSWSAPSGTSSSCWTGQHDVPKSSSGWVTTGRSRGSRSAAARPNGRCRARHR